MLSPAIHRAQRIVIWREDLAPMVDEVVAEYYGPDSGNVETREQIEAALWAWLGRAIDDLIEDASIYTHSSQGFRTWDFREAMRTWKPAAKQEVP